MRDFKSDKYKNNRPRRDFVGQSGSTAPQAINTVFQVHQVLEKIKNEPYFKWPNKMRGNPIRCNQSLHCQYHRNEGILLRTIELCGIIWNNWSEMRGYNSFCIGPMVKETKQGQGLRGMLLRGLLWAQLMSSLLLLGKLVVISPGWCLWLGHLSRTLILSRRRLEWISDRRWVFWTRTRLEPYSHTMILWWSRFE